MRRDSKEENLRGRNRAPAEDQKYYGEVEKENSQREEIGETRLRKIQIKKLFMVIRKGK